MDALRQILDIAVEGGHLYANPARNTTVAAAAKTLLKTARRQKAEKATMTLPSKEQLRRLVKFIREAGIGDCRAAADYVEFIAYCGARKTEASNVLWSDADFDRELIHLRVTKNGESRFVPMIAEMKALLERMKSERPDAKPDEAILLVKEVM